MQEINNKTKENPWKGLDSYKETEKLYGRDEEIESLYSRIIYNVQTVVYGRSGIGKSSILNAGIFPKARQEGILPVSIRLIHTTDLNNPSEPYIKQIISAVEKELKSHGGDLEEIVPQISSYDESLWEYLHRCTFWIGNGEERSKVRPLLVFDQFEEIFTLEKNHNRITDFFTQLTDLLNGIKPDYLLGNELTIKEESIKNSNSGNIFSGLRDRKKKSSPDYLQNNEFHIVFTLREDYLSYLERNTTNIPSLKLNRYCLQQINEEQAATIIMNPIPGLVEQDVAKLIIEKVTGETDFKLDGKPEIQVDLAILSLYLSRLYVKKNEVSTIITAELVNKFGDNIIQDFYMESINNVSEKTVQYIEDSLLNNDGRRENVSEYNAMHIGGISLEELRYLCEDKKLIRRFSFGGVIRIEFIHDILCSIVKERRDKRQMLKQQEVEKQKLLQEEMLKRKELEDKSRIEKEKIEWEARMARRKNKQRLIVAVSLVFLILVLWSGWYVLTIMPYSKCYGSFTTKNGWPVGIGKELNSDDQKNFLVYYKLTRRGWLPQSSSFGEKFIGNPYERVDILNAESKPTTNKLIESPLVSLDETESNDIYAGQFAGLLKKTSYWIFTADNNGNLTRKTAYSIDNKELYAVQFFHAENYNSTTLSAISSETEKEKILWGNYIDKEGKSMKVRDNGADRMRISVDKKGYYTGYVFYSESGTPQPNKDNVFGYNYKIGKYADMDGCLLEQNSLDAFGDSIIGENLKYDKFDDFGRWTESTYGKATYSKDLIVFANKMGNDTLRFDEKGNLGYRSYFYSNDTWNTKEYNNGSLQALKRFRKTALELRLIYMKKNVMGKDGRLHESIVFNADAQVPYTATRYEYTKNSTVISYFKGIDINNISQKDTIHDKDGGYHKLITETAFEKGIRRVTKAYKNIDDSLNTKRIFYRDESYYKGDNLNKRILYSKNGIYKSYLLEYKDGLLVSQSVMGVDGTPIRCPQWDENQLSYFKMKFVRNFDNKLVAIKAINEFGEESLITYKINNVDKEYKIEVVPSTYLKLQDANDIIIEGIQIRKISLGKNRPQNSIQYIHITNKKGTFYSEGIRDGDILLKEGKSIKVARPNLKQKTFDILTFTASEGDKGAEYYSVYYNNKEMIRLNKSIAKSR